MVSHHLVTGRNLSEIERQTLSTRKSGIVILPLPPSAAIFAQHGHNLHLVIERMLPFTLRGDDSFESLMTGCLAVEKKHFKYLAEPDNNSFYSALKDLYAVISTVWSNEPYSSPNIVVYEAHFHRYIGEALAIEVEYRHVTPLRL